MTAPGWTACCTAMSALASWPNWERTVFVVNRADELGTNPFDDEEAFAQLLGRKQTELLAALGASGTSTDGRIPAERIVFVASDPGGQVGDDRVATAADFDPFRGWDGMDEVRGAFEDLATDVAGNCVDVTLLHGGLARLGGLAASTRSEADAVRSEIEQLRRLRTDLDEIGQAAASIERSAVASAEDVVTGAVGQLVDAALATTVENDQKAILGRGGQLLDGSGGRPGGRGVDVGHAPAGRGMAAGERDPQPSSPRIPRLPTSPRHGRRALAGAVPDPLEAAGPTQGRRIRVGRGGRPGQQGAARQSAPRRTCRGCPMELPRGLLRPSHGD